MMGNADIVGGAVVDAASGADDTTDLAEQWQYGATTLPIRDPIS
jgi:hypothetical protein